MSGAGSIKVRKTRGGVSIRATGQAAEALAHSVGAAVGEVAFGKRLCVHFRDDGQDFLRFVIGRDGTVQKCEPYQSWVWEGLRVVRMPAVGELLTYAHRDNGRHQTIRYPIEKVEVLP